jgi:hypothetical protein
MIEHEADRNEMYRNAAARIEQRSAPAPERERTPPQRESSGQFRSNEPVYGREAEERAAGYKPLKEDRDEIDSDRSSIRDAANDRAKELQERPIEVHESGLDEKITLSAEQAAKRVADARKADVDQAELDGTKAAQKAVDDLRGETEPRQPQIEYGSEPDIEKVLSHPKVRDAISSKVTEAETQRAAYESSVKEIGKARVATLAADFPELANLPLDKWVGAITAMHQKEPARAKQVYDRLQALGQVENALIQIEKQKTERQQNEFKAYSAKENARFKELTKGIAPKEMSAIAAHIPTLLAESGVSDPRQFLQAIQGQTTFPRASAEALLIKAAKYDMMQKAAKPTPARAPLPPVQRPGVAQSRGNPQSESIRTLNAKLNATGDLKTAAALLAATRKGRR